MVPSIGCHSLSLLHPNRKFTNPFNFNYRKPDCVVVSEKEGKNYVVAIHRIHP